ncbi:MAG: beta-galactosidase [Candidatus Kryptonium sp.]
MEVTLKNNTIYVNNKPTFIYSGEIHYFRIKYDEWEDRILKAKDAGLNCISSYIPWIWHEPKEGFFDFTGETLKERNLLHFIDLVNKHGLFFIARIGPYFNAELIFDGLPAWLVKNKKIKRASEKVPHFLSYLDSEFLDYINRWYSALLPHIAQRQITRNGNIILIQLCNEIGVLNWLNKQPDLSKNAENLFKKYIKRLTGKTITQHELLKPLNKLTETFEKSIYLSNFYSFYFAHYFKTLKNFTLQHGIEIPFIANVAQFEDFHDRGRAFDAITTAFTFDEFTEKDPNVLLAGDFYPKRIDYDNFHDTIIAIEILKTFSHQNNPVLCMELQSGFIHDRPKIYPSDVELLTNTCIGHGVAGVNFYMFSGGVNYEKIGVYGRWHDWQSPISWDGTLKKSYYTIKTISKNINNLSELEKVYDVYVGIYKPYFSTMFLKGKLIDEIINARNLYFHDGLLCLLSTMNLNFKLINIEKNNLFNFDHLLLFSFDWMDEETQTKLINFANEKTLFLFYDIPTQNLKGQKTTIFKDVLNIKEIEKFKVNNKQNKPDDYYKFINIFNEEIPIFSQITTVELNDNFTEIARFKNKLAGFAKRTENGKIVFLGFGINHRYSYQINIMKNILGLAGIKPRVICSPEDIHASLLRKKDRYYLFIANYHEEEKEVKVTIYVDGREPINLKLLLQPKKSKIIEI